MRVLLLILLLINICNAQSPVIIASTIGTNRGDFGDYLFIVAGQSNVGTDPATGRVGYSLMPSYLKGTQTGVYYWNNAINDFEVFVPSSSNEWGFINEFMYYEHIRQGQNIYVVKHGLGGSRFAEAGTGSFYTRNTMKLYAKNAIAKFLTLTTKPRIVMFDSHGTTDGGDSDNSQEYVYTYKDFLAEMRTYLNLPNLKCIYERLSSNCTATFLSNIRTAQTTIDALPNNIMIDSDDCGYQLDGAHYSYLGAVVLGDRYSITTGDEINEDAVFVNTFNPIQLDPKAHFEARRVNVANTIAEIRESGAQDFVIKWNDLSGNNVRLKDLTTTHQPELISGGSDAAYLDCTTNASLSSGGVECTYFCLADYSFDFYVDLNDGQPAAQRVWMEANQGGDILSVYQEGVAPYKLVVRMVNNVAIFTKTGTTSPFVDGATGKKHVTVNVSYSTNQVSIIIDGVTQTLDAAFPGNISTFSTTGFNPGLFALMARDPYTAAGGFDGKMYAFTIFGSVLSGGNRTNVDNYYTY